MKMKSLILTMIVCICMSTTLMSQKKGEMKDINYRRSSLHTILMESDNFPRAEVVLKSYYSAPFPDKYNDHTIGTKSFDPGIYAITDEERAAAGTEQTKAGKFAKGAASSATAGIVDSQAADNPLIIEKYLKENKIANQMVAKWFNRQPDGSFNMDIISERGYYDASDLEANIATAAVKGISSLSDAGEELLNNTFVVVSKMNFVSNEIAAAIVREAAKLAAKEIKNPIAKKAAIISADKSYEKTKEGYSVWTTSYLYKLIWNDSIAAVFYNDLWINKSNIDTKKTEAFDNTNLFKLEYVGDEKSVSLVMFSLKEKRTEDQIVELATIRNIDAVYAKLQKKYDVFKTKTPLYTGNPITAKVGMKEGLEGGEKFEVLEQTVDSKTGLTKYVGKGTITVDEKKIWDNRYNAGEDPNDGNLEISETTFKGGKKYYSGLLIRQLK